MTNSEAISILREALESIAGRSGGFDWPPTSYWKDQIINECNLEARQALDALKNVEKVNTSEGYVKSESATGSDEEMNGGDYPLSAEAQVFVDKLLPCEPPCDSWGICDNCMQKSIHHAGYNQGYRAAMSEQEQAFEAKLAERWPSVKEFNNWRSGNMEYEDFCDAEGNYDSCLKNPSAETCYHWLRSRLGLSNEPKGELGKL